MYSKRVSCLLYAGDLVLFSESKQGLQCALNRLDEYCQTWHLNVNLRKTKIIVFTKGGRIPKDVYFIYMNNPVEIVTTYCYSGIVVNSAGTFKANNKHLYSKGQRWIC